MGCAESDSLSGDAFFKELDVIPDYIANLNRPGKRSTALKKCNLSFAEDANMFDCVFRQQTYRFPLFLCNEVFYEFDQLDAQGVGKVPFETFMRIALTKYPHISHQVVQNVYDYVSLDQTVLQGSVSGPHELNKQLYTSLMYVLHHYMLVRFEPAISLYLAADKKFEYHCPVQDLQVMFQAHFGTNSSEFLHYLRIPTQQQYKTLSFADFLQKLSGFLCVSGKKEPNTFVVQQPLFESQASICDSQASVVDSARTKSRKDSKKSKDGSLTLSAAHEDSHDGDLILNDDK